jgi:hypothetical protein
MGTSTVCRTGISVPRVQSAPTIKAAMLVVVGWEAELLFVARFRSA